MDKITTIETSSHLFNFTEMEKDIKRAKWYLVDIDSGWKSIKLTQPQILEYINKSFHKNFTLEEIDHRKIIAHDDRAMIILRDQSGDLK